MGPPAPKCVGVGRRWPVTESYINGAGTRHSMVPSRPAALGTLAPVLRHCRPVVRGVDGALPGSGFTYARNAAHLDLSPRLTVSMSTAPDQDRFAGMLEADARWLFRLLPQCPHARVMFLAGAVSKREYLFEFVRRVAPVSGFRLDP